LLIEDNPADADLVRDALAERNDLEVRHVERLRDALTSIESRGVDIILLDLSLPDATRLDGLGRLRAAVSEVPIVVLTGTMDERLGITAVQHGAEDYLFKGELTPRLLQRAVRYAIERRRFSQREKDFAQERAARVQLELAFKAGRSGSFDWNLRDNVIACSDEILALYGFDRQEFGGRYEDWLDCLVPADREACVAAITRALGTGDFVAEFRICRRDTGEVRWMEGRGQVLFDPAGAPARMIGVNVDITERKRADETLRRSEQALAEASDIAALGAWWIDVADPQDVDGSPLRWSEGVYRIFGYEPGEVAVTNALFYEAVHPEDRERVATAMSRAISERRPYSVEHRIIRADGAERVVFERAQITYDDRGRPQRIVGAVPDITERKRADEALRQSERRFRELADAMPQIVWAARADGSVDYHNRRGYELAGFDASRVHHDSWPERLHPDDRQRCRDAWHEAIRTGAPYEVESRVQFTRSGEYRWYLVRALPVRDDRGTIVRWYGTSTDIHDLKEAQEQLAAARTSAERAKAIAEQASRAKDHFLAVLSHELRTPLTPVLTGVSMLQKDAKLSAQARGYLDIVRRNAELESRLIDDLLDVTRIAQGKMELDRRRLELCTIIHRAVEVCRPDIEARRIHFDVDIGPRPYVVHADAARLQQAFWNLLKNAIKFTPQGGCVGIRCRPNNGHVVVDVMDSGIGIDRAALPYVFDPFVQAERSIAQQFGGLGLGLAIAKAMVEAHGGTIAAQSEGRNKGAVFTIRLPMIVAGADAVVATRGVPGAVSDAAGYPRLRVLLVEDHGDTAMMLRLVLEGAGHSIETAGDVATALAAATSRHFDLLVSDVGLPDGSGLDLIRELRARGSTVPAIAVSGYGHERDVQRSRAAGFRAHLVKPVDADRLLEAVARTARRPVVA
jgi:PAS domain S-box-containing protein